MKKYIILLWCSKIPPKSQWLTITSISFIICWISDLVLLLRLKEQSFLGYVIFMAEGKNQNNWQN